MRSARFVLLSATFIAAAALAGCGNSSDSTSDTAKPAGASASAGAQSASATPSSAPTMDADTRTTCTKVNSDLETGLANIAKAEAIGPPAGHLAVSAHYSASAVAIYLHTNTTNAAVDASATQLADALGDLGDKYDEPPASMPDKTPLNTAIAQFKAACAAS